MTFEALLAFFGILIAVLALARPVQRYSLNLFVPVRWLAVSIGLSFILILIRDTPLGIPPPFGWHTLTVQYLLTVASFLIPVLVALWGWMAWNQARLNERNVVRLGSLFTAALGEGEFDEVERILRRNQAHLLRLPAGVAATLFDKRMVAALVRSHSFVHLELLSQRGFLEGLDNPHRAVDAVVRQMLRSEDSPLRSAVVSRFGGEEHLVYTDSSRKMMGSTFHCPAWYVRAGAHYPLTLSAVETLEETSLDQVYNWAGNRYQSTQGLSPRSKCPVYLATKTEVLAIRAAIEAQSGDLDLYVSDLFDIFRAVQAKSVADPKMWESSLCNREYPTPFAYLLYEIASDLESLSSAAVARWSTSGIGIGCRLPLDLARTWSYCVWNISDSETQVTRAFRSSLIERYLRFVLALGWEPREILHASVPGVNGLPEWRDLFVAELKIRFAGASKVERQALRDGFELLDEGKRFVFEGASWLEKKLFH